MLNTTEAQIFMTFPHILQCCCSSTLLKEMCLKLTGRTLKTLPKSFEIRQVRKITITVRF